MEQVHEKKEGVDPVLTEKQLLLNLVNETKLLLERNRLLEKELHEKDRAHKKELHAIREALTKKEAEYTQRYEDLDKRMKEKEKEFRQSHETSVEMLEKSYFEKEAENNLEIETLNELLEKKEKEHREKLELIKEELHKVANSNEEIITQLKSENRELKGVLIEQKRIIFEKQHQIREVLLKVKNHFTELSMLSDVFDDLKVPFNQNELAYLVQQDLMKGKDYREITDYYSQFGLGTEHIMGIINKNKGFLE